MEIDIYKLASKYNLTFSEELALKYIVNNFEKTLEIGVRGVAKKCYASTSVVMNLAKKLGYSGFIDMVYRLQFQVFSQCLDNSNKFIEENLTIEKVNTFCNYLNNKKISIFVNGCGFSEIVAKYINTKLMILGYYSMQSEYIETMHKKFCYDSILIVVSKSGETSTLLLMCKYAKLHNIPIILFTGNKNSTLANISDLVFQIKDSNPSDDRIIQENDFFSNTIAFFEKLMSAINKF